MNEEIKQSDAPSESSVGLPQSSGASYTERFNDFELHTHSGFDSTPVLWRDLSGIDPGSVAIAQGDVFFIGDNKNIKRLAPGTSGQFLQTQGASANPVWATSVPTGTISAYGASTAPTSWLLCDGAAVSRTTYAALFAIISTTYGAGDGSTTFNVPNLKGRVPVGLDAAQTEFDALAETGGTKTHTLVTSEIPAHTHTVPERGKVGAGDAATQPRAAAGANDAIDVPATGSTGGGGAHQNLQPYLVINYIIKT